MKQRTLVMPRLNALTAAVATCFTVNALALPSAPTVTNGTASFQQTTNSLTVTNSNGAIINWNSFSVGAGETTRFIQPSASSSVLNRVLGSDPSQIYGSLSSNGRIYLVNPAGIFVGPGGSVNAAAFIASSLAISDTDFLAGRLIFNREGSAGTVENQGIITTPEGGSVYLIGSQVINSGAIDAPNGQVLLAAGQSVQLINTGTPGVAVEFSANDELVQNFGTIAAAGGQIGLAGALVKNSGSLNASSVSREGGRIFLRASKQVEVDAAGRIVVNGTTGGSVQLHSDDTTLVSGVIEAAGSSGTGGRVEILGDKVAVFDGASVDASGTGGGGTILVGGDLQGRNTDLQNAQVTWFGRDASLSADALGAGDGGKIIVWADDTTRAYGEISVRGGANGGDGGFVEVSGKRYLEFDATVDRSAPHGTSGTLLLDPMDIEITTSSAYSANAGFIGSNPAIFSSSADETTLSTISNSAIEGLLSTGSVVITTSDAGGTEAGLIVVRDPVTWSTNNTLKLYAHSDIRLDAVVESTGTSGGLELVAGWNGNIATPGISGGGNIEQYGGALLLPILRASAGGSVLLNNSVNRVNDLTAFSSTGNISYTGGGTFGNNEIYLRNLQASNGSVTVNTNNTYGGDITLGYVEATTSAGGTVSITAAKAILEDDVGTTDILADIASLTSNFGGTSSGLAISADINLGSSATAIVTANASYGGIRLANTGSSSFDVAGTVSTNDQSSFGGNTTYVGKGDIALGAGHQFNNSSQLGTLRVSTPQDILVSGFVGDFQNTTLSAGGNIDVSGNLFVSNVASLSAGSTLSVGGTVDGDGGIGLSAPVVLIDGEVTSTSGAVSIVGNTVAVGSSFYGWIGGDKGVSIAANSGFSMDNGSVINTDASFSSSFNGDIALVSGGNIRLENGSSIYNDKFSGPYGAPLANIAISARGNLVLNDGSSITASDDVFIEMTGGSSKIVFNEAGGAPSYILSDASSGVVGTTYISFLGVASGGVIINGTPTTTSVPGGSGFFNINTSTPSVLGSGLRITYASGVDPVSKEIGSIFDDDTRDTEDINDFETEEVKERADEFAEENSDESGKSKPSQCT